MLYRQNSPWDKTVSFLPFFPYLLWFRFRGISWLPTAHKGVAPSLALLPIIEEPASTMEEPSSSSSEWTFAVCPAPGKCVSSSWCLVWLRPRGSILKVYIQLQQFVSLHYSKLCGSTTGEKGQCGFQLKLPIEDGFMFGLFQTTLGRNLSSRLSSWKHFPFLVQRV